ncbi:MAG: 50S ribosomal protein L29 [Paludibacteraceae bacterium]|jgi:ribosomal protein L29|nr:50S ribosomal protein L29 [Paludibacteraceae bacterium]
MKIAELKNLTTQELQERLATEEQKLAKLKLTHSVSPLDNPMQIRAARKDIARINTELRLREINK